jgi:serine/threonine protein kinase
MASPTDTPEDPSADKTVELSIPQATDVWIGPYKLLRKIGAGGMGEIHLAEDARLNRKVAIKLLPTEFTQDDERVRRFEREAKAASALNHPNIITIYEIGEADGAHYIVTEYIQGKTLREQMHERMTIETTLDVATQMASALKAAHEVGIVHRDIKPENVMVRPDGLVKVLDFGIAKLVERSSEPPSAPDPLDGETASVQDPDLTPTAPLNETATGIIMGTVSYMPPELLRGQKVDSRADIFSLGVMLYEVIAGTSPFAGSTQADRIAAILEREPAPLAGSRPEVPNDLERIVSKALRKDRDARYQRVEDLLGDLIELKQELEFQAKLGRSSPLDERDHTAAVRSSESDVHRPVLSKALPRIPMLAGLAALMVVAVLFFLWFSAGTGGQRPALTGGPPIKVGVLHSRSGTMAIDERPVIDATLFAIEEITRWVDYWDARSKPSLKTASLTLRLLPTGPRSWFLKTRSPPYLVAGPLPVEKL